MDSEKCFCHLNGYAVKDATARKLINKRTAITPFEFGAVGDGLADDSAAFGECFANGGTIYIPEGNYLIRGTVTIPDGTKVTCDGWIIRDPSDTKTLFEVGNDCEISLNINGMDPKCSARHIDGLYDIYANAKENVKFLNCKIKDSFSNCSILARGSKNIVFSGCYVNGYNYGALAAGYGSSQVSFINNRVIDGRGTYAANRYPISISWGTSKAYPPTVDAICTGNYIEDVTPYWEGIDAHGLINGVIANNIIKNVKVGISAFGETNKYKCENVTICDNIIYTGEQAGTSGIECVRSTNCIIANNTVHNAENGIRIHTVVDMVVSGNVLNGTGTGDGISTGAVSDNYTERLRIFGNNIKNYQYGVNIEACFNSLTKYVDIDIRNNVFKSCEIAINDAKKWAAFNYMKAIYVGENIYQDVTSRYGNFGYGIILGVSSSAPNNYGREGMIVYSMGDLPDVSHWYCRQGGTEEGPPTWIAVK